MQIPETSLGPVEDAFLDRMDNVPILPSQENVLFDYYRSGWNDAVSYLSEKEKKQMTFQSQHTQYVNWLTLVCVTLMLFLFLIFYIAPWLRAY